MSFLKKLFRLGGCSRLYSPDSVEAGIVMMEEEECLECGLENRDNGLADLQYIPWTSPGISRRLVDKVKDSPKIARKMITKMTSPGRRHRKQIHDEEIFIVSVNVLHTSGHSGHGDTLSKKDAWTSMGENIKNFTDDFDSDDSSSDSDDSDDDSNDDSDSEADEWRKFV